VSAIFPVFRSEILSIHPYFRGTSHFRRDALRPGSNKEIRAMQTLLLVAELIIAVALICFVLLQRSEGGALGMGGGGGGMGGLFTARGAADTLTRTTSILAFLFFATCIVLNILALHGRDQTSILDTVSAPVKTAPAPLPIGPSVPKPR
jgi:preprotein translocase subunit SecG